MDGVRHYGPKDDKNRDEDDDEEESVINRKEAHVNCNIKTKHHRFPDFVEEAHEYARLQVSTWIRATFHEVVVQSLKHTIAADVSSSNDDHEHEFTSIFECKKRYCNNSSTKYVSKESNQYVLRNCNQVPNYNKFNDPVRRHKEIEDNIMFKIGDDAIKLTQEICQLISDKWCQKLISIGHFKAAEWIQSITDSEKGTLYFIDDEEIDVHSDCFKLKKSMEKCFDNSRTEVDETLHTSKIDVCLNKRPPKVMFTGNPQGLNFETDSSRNVHVKELAAPCQSTAQITTTSLLNRLRLVGYHNVLALENCFIPPRAAIEQLNGIAQECYGPKYWSVVHNACRKIPSRLHNNAVNASNAFVDTSKKDPTVDTYQSSCMLAESTELRRRTAESLQSAKAEELSDNYNTNDVSLKPTEVQLMLVNRKRKWRSRRSSVQLARKSKTNTDPFPSTALVGRDENDSGRVPCPVHALTFTMDDVQTQLSESEKYELNMYLHELNSQRDPNTCTMLGALRNVGQFHFFHDYRFRNRLTPASEVGKLTEKQIRRHQRDSIRERLGDHFCSAVDSTGSSSPSSVLGLTTDAFSLPNQRASRVLPTINRQMYAPDSVNPPCVPNYQQRYWFDLDMGHCILELVDPTDRKLESNVDSSKEQNIVYTEQKILCSFPNVEIMLLDGNSHDYSEAHKLINDDTLERGP